MLACSGRQREGQAAVRRLCLRRRLRDGPKQVYYTVCDAVIRVLRGVRTPRQRYGFYRVVSDHELGWNLDDWARYLRSIPHGTSELVCHPGFRHEVDEDPPDMREQRVRESKLLTNREALRMIRDSAVALVNFTTV